MNSLARFASAIVVSLALFVGCYRASQYSGDGQLIDNGIFTPTDRYILHLGSVNLTQRAIKTFHVGNLPASNFVVGFKVIPAPGYGAIINGHPLNPIVSLELSGPGGKILFTRKAPLKTWTWLSPSTLKWFFVYGRDGSRGSETYFDALPYANYTLTVGVLEPDSSRSKYTALLMAKSGGWK